MRSTIDSDPSQFFIALPLGSPFARPLLEVNHMVPLYAILMCITVIF